MSPHKNAILVLNMGLILSIILSFVLLYVTINLTGMVVRGFFRNATLEKLKNDEKAHSFIKTEIDRNNRVDDAITVVFAIISISYLYLLYRFFSFGVVVAVLIIVVARVPDLVWEIKNGRKVTRSDGPKGGIHSITGIMGAISLLLLWWLLYTQ